MRKDWDLYFMDIAKQVATRASCNRKSVGTVIVREKTIIVTGYNGSVRGEPHCDDVGHMLINDSCARVVHSEANAIAQAARNGTATEGATLYVTASPCWPCFKLLVNAGIKRIVYAEKFYRDNELIHEVAERQGLELVFLEPA
jgi:dCMP deaminase